VVGAVAATGTVAAAIAVPSYEKVAVPGADSAEPNVTPLLAAKVIAFTKVPIIVVPDASRPLTETEPFDNAVPEVIAVGLLRTIDATIPLSVSGIFVVAFAAIDPDA
jgi:hypothetical protein